LADRVHSEEILLASKIDVYIEAYVKDQTWQIQAIQEGVREADIGNFATDKDVKKAFKKWGVNQD
jgi:predicted transcriptional regulator